MAQIEQQVMYFEAASGQVFLDLSAALTACNHKQYHQVTRDGDAYCYHATVRVAGRNTSGTVHTAPTNWCVRNAVKMTSAGWQKQYRNAGLSAGDLPRYGKRLRASLDGETLDYTFSESGRNIEALSSLLGLQPRDAAGAAVFVPYDDTGGDQVDYYNGNPVTRVAITNLSTGVTTEQDLTLLDNSSLKFNMVEEYHASRRNIETLETDNTPESTSKMMTLFSSAEEASETIVEAMDDTGDNRPYSDETTLVTWGDFNSVTSAVDNSDPSDVTASNWPGPSITFHAPLGLVKLTGFSEGMKVIIEVHSIYKM